MAASDEIVFAMAIAKCVLIVSCAFGTIVYLAWVGGKRMFSDEDGSAVVRPDLSPIITCGAPTARSRISGTPTTRKGAGAFRLDQS
jgi:hypothetical protein